MTPRKGTTQPSAPQPIGRELATRRAVRDMTAMRDITDDETRTR